MIESGIESGIEPRTEPEMIKAAVHRLLSESAQKAIETMFFAMPDSVSMDAGRPPGALIAASLTFQGTPPGRFGLWVSNEVARALAGNFIGYDDAALLAPDEVTGVIGELANMLCGVALSELESQSNFELSTPESAYILADEPAPDYAAGSPTVCRFEFPEGALAFFLEFEERT
jgi:chemotaxis protein CheY-P-specific phosphatase CheC